jgi:transglutaminase-like putative cysteine protease
VSVPFNLRLPENTRYLRVRLSGLDLKDLDIDGGRQSVTGDVLEVRGEDLSVTPFIPESLRNPGEYLRSTLFVQSDDPRIVALSEEITGREKDKLGAARLLYRWVYTNVEKAPSTTLPVATEVLQTKKGDCNEHTTLFTALSRAAGIPTRMALGLVYREGSFYYHAWPEIFIGRWIAVDPTLGQFPADAAHIRLISGDLRSQIRILGVIGKIKIEGLNYR